MASSAARVLAFCENGGNGVKVDAEPQPVADFAEKIATKLQPKLAERKGRPVTTADFVLWRVTEPQLRKLLDGDGLHELQPKPEKLDPLGSITDSTFPAGYYVWVELTSDAAASGGGGSAAGSVGAAWGPAEVLARLDALRLEQAAAAAKQAAAAAKQAASLDALRLEQAATAAKVDAIAAAAPQQEHVTSPALLASRTLEVLRAATLAATGRMGVFDFTDSTGPPVLDEQQLVDLCAARDMDKEVSIIRYLTPILWDIVACCRADSLPPGALCLQLVNSERFRWMDFLDKPVATDKLLQKPDLFVTWEPFVAFRAASGKQGTGAKYLYGPLAHRALQLDGCAAVIMEAKQDNLTGADFGEIVNYHSHLRGYVHGMLFNHTDCWLTAAVNGQVVRLEKCKWGQPGTHELLQRHIAEATRTPPPLAVLLSKLLVDLRLTLARSGDSSFLGAGASGRVFAVTSASGALCALKVVADAGAVLPLTAEFTLLQIAAAAGAPVARVVADSLRVYTSHGGGYLMGDIGARIRVDSRDQLRRVFGALQRVHAARIIHGDARLPNVVEVDGTVCWLDLVHAVAPPPSRARGEEDAMPTHFVDQAREDMLTLASSVLNVKRDMLAAGVRAAAGGYHPLADGGSSSQTVADSVWESRR